MMTAAGQSLLATFDRIRIINLRTRKDRRADITREFARLGLSIDGGRVAFHDACRPEEPGGFPSIGTRGCFFSHLQILEAALVDGVRNVLILEDDLDFSDDAEARMSSTLDKLTEHRWGMFYGGHEAYDIPSNTEGPLVRANPDKGVLTAHFLAFSQEATRLAVPYLTAMAARQAGSPEGGPMHVDGAYGWLRKAYPQIETWLAAPVLGHQRPSRTDIHDLRFFDRMPVLRDIAAVARRLKRRQIRKTA